MLLRFFSEFSSFPPSKKKKKSIKQTKQHLLISVKSKNRGLQVVGRPWTLVLLSYATSAFHVFPQTGYEKWSPESSPLELTKTQVGDDNQWKPAVDESNARLKR